MSRAFPGLWIAADIDANHPFVGSTTDDPASLSSHTCLLKQEKAAHVAAAEGCLIGGSAKGRLTGVQCLPPYPENWLITLAADNVPLSDVRSFLEMHREVGTQAQICGRSFVDQLAQMGINPLEGAAKFCAVH
jgi:hypothetical protein